MKLHTVNILSTKYSKKYISIKQNETYTINIGTFNFKPIAIPRIIKFRPIARLKSQKLDPSL